MATIKVFVSRVAEVRRAFTFVPTLACTAVTATTTTTTTTSTSTELSPSRSGVTGGGGGGYISVGVLLTQVVHKGGQQGSSSSLLPPGVSGKSSQGGLSQGGNLSVPVATAQGLDVARMLCAQGTTSSLSLLHPHITPSLYL